MLFRSAVKLGSIYRVRVTQPRSSELDEQDVDDNIPGMPDCQKWYLLAKLEDTLNKEHQWHQFYAEPVDTVKLEIPEYKESIEYPMDLGTMYSKLANDQYDSVQAFDDDLSLIVNNALEFNGPHHPVTQLGEAMFACTREFMGKVPSPNQAQSIDDKSSRQNNIEVVTVEVALDSHRALALWSRWLYGGPMWDEEGCTDFDEELSSLASIYRLCAGSWWSACQHYDGDGMNASLDAIREIVVTQTCELSQLFLQLSRQLESTESMVAKMLIDVLVHRGSVEDEDVLEWPRDLEEKHPEFFGALGFGACEEEDGEGKTGLHGTLRISHTTRRLEVRQHPLRERRGRWGGLTCITRGCISADHFPQWSSHK